MAVTTNKPLTDRQAEILDLLNSGLKPKQVAEKLGITEAGVYQTRRRLQAAGHLPKTRRASARKQRSLTAPVHVPRVYGDSSLIDPVEVISRRIEIVREEIHGHSAQISESTVALESLTEETKRLTKALKALTPSSNGRRTNTSARKRRATTPA